MPPTAVVDTTFPADHIADLKGKVQASAGSQPKPALADNYMYDFKYNHALPTKAALGTSIAEDVNVNEVAEELVDTLAKVLGEGDAEAFAALFLDYGVWRDKLAYTWDYRTFNFRENILKAATDLLPSTRASKFELFTPAAAIQRPYPDLEYLQFCVKFDTNLVHATAMANAVLTSEGWKIWTLHTVAEDLIEFPEVPPADGHMTGAISYEAQRAKDDDEIQPDVLIIGGGQK